MTAVAFKPGARATAHLERGPSHVLPCWCDIGHDHTFEEFFEALEEPNPLDAIPDEPEYPHPREDY